jgi:hypothetical protein
MNTYSYDENEKSDQILQLPIIPWSVDENQKPDHKRFCRRSGYHEPGGTR